LLSCRRMPQGPKKRGGEGRGAGELSNPYPILPSSLTCRGKKKKKRKAGGRGGEEIYAARPQVVFFLVFSSALVLLQKKGRRGKKRVSRGEKKEANARILRIHVPHLYLINTAPPFERRGEKKKKDRRRGEGGEGIQARRCV